MIEYILNLSNHSNLINNIFRLTHFETILAENTYQYSDFIVARCYFEWDVIESVVQTQSFVGVT